MRLIWEWVSGPGSYSANFEDTVAITKDVRVVLTR